MKKISPQQGIAKSDGIEYLVFMLGDEEYAIDILKIREIKSYQSLLVKELNDVPDYISGITSINSVVVPIIDLRLLYHINKLETNEYTIVIVLIIGDKQHVGIVVSAVTDIIALTKSQIEPTSSYEAVVSQPYVSGIAVLEEHLIAIIDPEKILSHHAIDVANIKTLG